jgi:hypothetical protein
MFILAVYDCLDRRLVSFSLADTRICPKTNAIPPPRYWSLLAPILSVGANWFMVGDAIQTAAQPQRPTLWLRRITKRSYTAQPGASARLPFANLTPAGVLFLICESVTCRVDAFLHIRRPA